MAWTPQNTASTHKSSFFRGTHHFHIIGYRVRKVNNPIRSGDFLAGGHTWAIICGFGDNGDGHLESITLELVSIGKGNVVAMAGLHIDDPRDRWPAAVWQSDDPNVFSKTGKSWKLTVPDSFRGHEPRYVVKDCLTILCTVDVLEETPAATTTENRFVVPVPSSPTISEDLEKLVLMDAAGCMPPDVTFVVEHKEIKAHKLVLAMRSSVFAAEFRWHSSTSTERACPAPIRIDDMSASTFRAMLRFIYTDELPIKTDVARRACKEKYAARRCEAMAPDLLVAADRYDLGRLRLMCEKILSDSLDVATVMATLMLVRGRHNCRQLEDSCIQYIATHPDVFEAVVASEEYQELKQTCSSLIIEIVERVAIAGRNPSADNSNSHRFPSEKSSSTFQASEEVHGCHEFKILNLNAVHRSHAVGQEINSGTFKVGGYDWMLDVYPSGKSDDVSQYIAIYLRLQTDLPKGTPGVMLSRNFKIKDPSGTWPPILAGGSVLQKRDSSWGYHKFIRMEDAKSKYMANDGSLTICCDINVNKKPYTTRTSTIGAGVMVAVPPSEISTQLEQLLASGDGSDVSFLVDNKSEIRAHKLIIAARSPALHDAVLANKEDGRSIATTVVVRVDDMKAVVFKAMLHFIYTDELLPEDGASGLLTGDMLTAACRFGMKRMKAMCENLMCQSLSKENVLAIAKLAHRHHCKELQDYCIEFLLATPNVAKELMKTIIGLED